MLAVIGNARAVDVKTGKDFRDALVKTKHNLNMTSWVFRDDGYGILGADSGGLGEDTVSNSGLNLFDLLNGFLLVQSVQKDIDIGSWGEIFVIVRPKGSLNVCVSELLRARAQCLPWMRYEAHPQAGEM